MTQKNIPEKKFRAGALSATIWRNQSLTKDGKEIDYSTVSIDRRYKDKDDNWKSTSSFRVSDLPKLIVTLQKAYEYLVINDQSLNQEEIIM